MNILISNDDGITSEGIRLLVDTAKEFGNVFVVAPKTQQSAVGQGLTIHEPISIDEEKGIFDDVLAYSISAKPADCIKVALEHLFLEVDMVFSGVNNGPNLGTDILYSGTLAAASEARVLGKPAIAFSTDFDNFAIAREKLKETIDFIFKNVDIQKHRLLNVNFPLKNSGPFQGYRFTTQGIRVFSSVFRHENGKYWQEGDWQETENEKSSDVYAANNGFVSITPLVINRTDYKGLSEILAR